MAMTEVELCDILKKSNLFPGFTLHEEVGISGVSCDMIYENGSQVFTIEAKTELNYKVFAQACRWRNVATISYVAIPAYTMKDWYYSPKKVILEELGLGLIIVDSDGAKFGRTYNPFEQKDFCAGANNGVYLFPADMDYWKTCFERIGENQAPAGSKLGKRSTTFSRTIDALKLEAKKHPDYTLKQLLLEVPTHYSNVVSAEQAIKRYAKMGIIEKFWKVTTPQIFDPPKSRRATNLELSRWLAQGNGECLGSQDDADTAWNYPMECSNVPLREGAKVRKWSDTEWHEPDVDYLFGGNDADR